MNTQTTPLYVRGDLLALGFGTTVAMWAIGYFTHLPAVMLPSPLVLPLMLLCLLAGGFLAGKYTRRGVRGGMYTGLIASLLNLLILGSLLSGEQPNQIVPTAALWLPGSILLGIGLGTLGAWLGAKQPYAHPETVPWTGYFADVAVIATFLLLLAGGLVTSNDAGLAVVDWPNSYGYNMFLYPFAKMTSQQGVFYEHAHRLFGSLVGLTMVVLAIHLWRTDHRKWLRRLTAVAVILVIVQGILGGLRVTGHFTLSTSPEEVAPNIYLAIVHGVLGQIFFATIVSIAVFTSKSWSSDLRKSSRFSASTDYMLNTLLVVLLIVQLVYGALVRHISGGLLFHITLACVIFVNAVGSGVRAWGLYAEQKILNRLGLSLAYLIVVQIVLGFSALAAIGYAKTQQQLTVYDVTLTTLHQATGAALLALAVMLMLWSYRLLERPAEEEKPAAELSSV